MTEPKDEAPKPKDEAAKNNGLVPAELSKTLSLFIEAQAQDLAVKSEQNQIERERLEIDKQKDANAFQFGMASLAAQKEDRVHERECARGQRKDAQKLIIWLLVIIALLIGYALYLDKEALALELVKAVVFLVAGGAAGYGIAANKKQKGSSSQDGDGD
ncbi:hypothetical protein ABB26_05145 [Stenotrophomonas humi]|uniref:Transmembrane protein n=1 Tax=Stenotrophomonas humi TaxID=405444 RepID=A0A0R0CJS9_9GAMM|nr:hypothetical protein [Stenotrophomonas humi]KRG65192.1 hypothetical protein ABB26_05145 [Stenotrophomonas humi]